jgi:tRNA nucleotidyltransferase (CCA-adding enzyme)
MLEAEALLDPAVHELLLIAAAAGRAQRVEAWVVGGLVRDLLLGRGSRDVDLAVEGDGPAFAARLGAHLDVPVARHRSFETAHLTWRDVEVDVVSTRRERYPRPAALPRVERGTLRDDLERRDYTVNALATPLDGFPAGDVVDPMGGLDDLSRRLLRVHHRCSFGDDPTRVLRGVELEVRLGFRFEPETERLAAACLAAGGLGELSGARLREAWRRAFASGEALRPKVERLEELGGLRAAGLDAPQAAAVAGRLEGLLERACAARVDLPPVGDLVLSSLLDDAGSAARVAVRFALAGEAGRRLATWPPRARMAAAALAGSASPAGAERAVEDLSDGELLALTARLPRAEAAEAATDVLLRRRRFRLTISGGDLVRRGVAEGPAIGRALEQTRRARLDGGLAAEDELEHALGLVRGGEG